MSNTITVSVEALEKYLELRDKFIELCSTSESEHEMYDNGNGLIARKPPEKPIMDLMEEIRKFSKENGLPDHTGKFRDTE